MVAILKMVRALVTRMVAVLLVQAAMAAELARSKIARNKTVRSRKEEDQKLQVGHNRVLVGVLAPPLVLAMEIPLKAQLRNPP